MKHGLALLLISALVAGVAWLVAGAVFVALTVGIVTFLFSLLGGLCYASDAYIGDTYGRDGDHGYNHPHSEFGGRCTSGSWK